MAEQNPTANDLKKDVSAAGQQAKKDLNEGARKIGDDIRDTANKMSHNQGADNLKDRGADLAKEARDTAQEYVEDRKSVV